MKVIAQCEMNHTKVQKRSTSMNQLICTC